MQEYFNQVRHASRENLYYVALSGALMIPDMCSGMETLDGKTSGLLYKAWINKYVTPKISNLSGKDCWGFRCSLLHQGSMGPHQGIYNRVLFVEPGSSNSVFHNNVINDALNIDVSIFIETMVSAAEDWLALNEETPNYINNSKKYMRRYPCGLSPYISGVPVIA